MTKKGQIKQCHDSQLIQVDDRASVLRSLMQRADIPSYRALAAQAQVSRWQVQQLRTGNNIAKMRVAVVTQLADALNISIGELLSKFGLGHTASDSPSQLAQLQQEYQRLQQEYQRLQQEMAQQQEMARSQFQTEALQTLETWLVQWPTITKRAQEKGDTLAAVKILPFVRPVERLMAEWGVEAIAPIDAQVPYDPQIHQLTSGTANPGNLIQVTHSGHRHQSNLLHRSKVKPLPQDTP